MKKSITISLIIVLIFLIIATPFAVILGIGFSQPRFSETYYGELALMYEKLTETEGKKIVVIGNSAVAFGIDSSLIQEELEADGYDYTVCNFGLYGSIGTKVMLELSEDYIGEGDIVLFVPEYDVQSLICISPLWICYMPLKANFQWCGSCRRTSKPLSRAISRNSPRKNTRI